MRESKILFLECTYVDADRNVERARAWGHTHLDEIIAHAKEFKNERIVLIHFSKRYKHSHIRDIVKRKTPDILKGRIHCFYHEKFESIYKEGLEAYINDNLILRPFQFLEKWKLLL